MISRQEGKKKGWGPDIILGYDECHLSLKHCRSVWQQHHQKNPQLPRGLLFVTACLALPSYCIAV